MANQFKLAARFPKLSDRAEISQDELANYDFLLNKIDLFRSKRPNLVGGHQFGVPAYSALAVSPSVGKALCDLSAAIMKPQGTSGSYAQRDHEWIDFVIAFDSGYWALVAGHTPSAIACGISEDALEALADSREELLREDDRQVIEFIRAVRDGGVTDEMWLGMKQRWGTDRGVVDFVGFVLVVYFHHHFSWAVGVPEMTREAWREMIADFRNGTRSTDENR